MVYTEGTMMWQHTNICFWVLTLWLVVLATGLFAGINTANAQFVGTETSEETDTILEQDTFFSDEDALFTQPVEAAAPVVGTDAAGNVTTQSISANGANSQTTSETPNTPPKSLVLWLFEIVVGFLGKFVGWAGLVLNYAVNEFVLGFGQNVTGTGVGAAIDQLWSVVRDFFNILFIFAIIYLGFKMVLGSDDSGTRRQLVYLIIAALLVNFSLFISKFIVDFSNVLASEVAEAAFPACVRADGSCGASPNGDTVDIGTNFIYMMGIPGSQGNLDTNLLNGESSPWGFIFGLAVVYVVAIFAFMAGAIMLIIRYAALCVFMVLSPFMFIGWILPQFQSTMNKYWSGFMGRAFFAPAYILLLYFSGMIIQASFHATSGFGGSNGAQLGSALSLANGTQIVNTFGANIGPFILSTVMLIMSVQVANYLSADGAKGVLRVGGNMVKGGQRRLQNSANWAGRTSLSAAKTGAAVTAGYGARKMTNALGNQVNAYMDRKQREGSKLARNWYVDEAVRGASSKLKGAKFGLSTTVDERDKKQAAINSRANADADIAAGQAELAKPESERDLTKIQKMQSAIGNLSQKRFEQMSQAELEAITPYMKAAQFEKFLDSDDVSSSTQDAVFGARKKAIEATLEATGKDLREAIGKLSIKQIEVLGDEFIRENADLFTKDQFDAIKKSDKFVEAQKGAYIGGRKSSMIKRAESGDAGVETLTEGQKPAEIAQYPAAVLMVPGIMKKITPDVLKQIVKKDSLTASEKDALRDEIVKNGNDKSKDYLKTAEGVKEWYDGEKKAIAPKSKVLGPDGKIIT